MPHAHAACTCRVHMPRAHAARRMHMPHAHAACTCRMHIRGEQREFPMDDHPPRALLGLLDLVVARGEGEEIVRCGACVTPCVLERTGGEGGGGEGGHRVGKWVLEGRPGGRWGRDACCERRGSSSSSSKSVLREKEQQQQERAARDKAGSSSRSSRSDQAWCVYADTRARDMGGRGAGAHWWWCRIESTGGGRLVAADLAARRSA